MGFCVRPMKIEHLGGVLDIEVVSYPTPWSRSAFLSEILENRLAHYFVVLPQEDHVKPIAYGGMWIIIDEAHITNIAVHPDYRGRGIGKELIEYLLAKAVILGAVRATLEVRPSNLRAQRLYERVGFRPVGLRRGYYTDTGEDAIIMWKQLLPSKRED